MTNSTTSKTRAALLHDVDKLKHNAVQVAEDVREHATAHVDATKQRVTDAFQNVREDVLNRPLFLVGVGLVLGLLLGSRLRR